MRIPRVHDLTLGYFEHFGLELRPFVMGNPKGLVHVGGKRMTAEQAGLDARTSSASPWPSTSAAARVSDLWEEATRDLRALARGRPGRRLGADRTASTTATPSASSSR